MTASNSPDTLVLDEIETSIKRWSGNTDRDYDWEPCVLCRRPVRMDRPVFMICMIDGGSKLIAFDAVTAEIEDRSDFVGCHPVGSSCRKKLPKRFVQRFLD
tara:strand:+ start:969 stop:1271 length:303 start_codon:yes stop_codon:yes gene_type:complete